MMMLDKDLKKCLQSFAVRTECRNLNGQADSDFCLLVISGFDCRTTEYGGAETGHEEFQGWQHISLLS